MAEIKEIVIRIERNYQGQLQLGTMRNGVWHYGDLPQDVQTKAQIEAFISARGQGKPYRLTYQDNIQF